MKRLFQLWLRVVEGCATLFAILACMALVASMLVLLRESLGRYIFNAPTEYAYMFSAQAVVLVLYFGLAHTLLVRANVASDIIYGRIGFTFQRAVDLLAHTIAAVIGSTIAWFVFHRMIRSYAISATIPDLFGLPAWIMLAAIVAGSALFALAGLTLALADFAALTRGLMGKKGGGPDRVAK